jgi:hypothetical protein
MSHASEESKVKTRNRLANYQPDYLFTIVRKPLGWHPKDLDDIPPSGEILSLDYVPSYTEAYDDLLRCNQLALEQNLGKWAVIQCPDGNL